MGATRAWIFNHYAQGPDLPGGTRHFDLGRELVRRGHQVTVFASSFHHYLHRETRLQPGERWKIEDIEGVRFIWLRTPAYTRNDWRRVWSMVVFMARAWWVGHRALRLKPEVGKPDAIIGSSPHLLAALAAWRVARHYRVAFIMEVRDLWPQAIVDLGALRTRNPVVRALQALEKLLYRRAERIITLLPLAHQYISGSGVTREKIVWIPNGLDLARPGAVSPSPRGTEAVFRVAYVGAHGEANALHVVIQAAKTLQDERRANVRFVLVGDGPEKPGLVGLARKLGVHNVEFREPVPKARVAQVLAEADALLLNLGNAEVFRYGISSNKLFDYLGAAKPVILAVDAPGNPVEEAACGLNIPGGDSQALADVVIRLAQMPREEREAMGERGRAYVEEHHDIVKLAAKLEEVLIDVVRP